MTTTTTRFSAVLDKTMRDPEMSHIKECVRIDLEEIGVIDRNSPIFFNLFVQQQTPVDIVHNEWTTYAHFEFDSLMDAASTKAVLEEIGCTTFRELTLS